MANEYKFEYEEEGEPLSLSIPSDNVRSAIIDFSSMTESDVRITNIQIKNLSVPDEWSQEQQNMDIVYSKGRYSIIENEDGFSPFSKKMGGSFVSIGISSDTFKEALNDVQAHQSKSKSLKI